MRSLRLPKRVLRRLYPHNPVYLVSAWVVLHGLSIAFADRGGRGDGQLLMALLCGYTAALAVVVWLVVYVAKIWDDARTVMLALFLMYAALATSHDDLCLHDPRTGAQSLAVGFVFCVLTTEAILWALRMRLSPLFRVPMYLQLGAMFAFPPVLGWFSLSGNDPGMLLGVAVFPVVAGLAVLTLLPATRLQRSDIEPNGTPWSWPLYPWSLFALVVVALGVRTWMLTVAFSPTSGSDAAFQPYLLAPLLLAVSAVLLELGLRHRSRTTQATAVGLTGLSVLIALPIGEVNPASEVLVDQLVAVGVWPPMVVAVAGSAVAFYAMLRGVAATEAVLLSCVAAALTFTNAEVAFSAAVVPSDVALLGLATYLIGRGLWRRSTLRLGIGGALAAVLLFRHAEIIGLQDHAVAVAVRAAAIWWVLVPLLARDAWANWLRETGPVWALGASFAAACDPYAPSFAAGLEGRAFAVALVAAIIAVYWVLTRQRRWAVPFATAMLLSSTLGGVVLLRLVPGGGLRTGLTWYAAGLGLLAAGLAISLAKAGLAWRLMEWIATPQESPGSNNGGS